MPDNDPMDAWALWQEFLWQLDRLRGPIIGWAIPALAAYLGISLAVRGVVGLTRAKRGRCQRCGHDVRGQQTRTHCAECGRILPMGPGKPWGWSHARPAWLKLFVGVALAVPLAVRLPRPEEGYLLGLIALGSAVGLGGLLDAWWRRGGTNRTRLVALVATALLLQLPAAYLAWHTARWLRAREHAEAWRMLGVNSNPHSKTEGGSAPPWVAWLPAHRTWAPEACELILWLDPGTTLESLAFGPPDLVTIIDWVGGPSPEFGPAEVQHLCRFPKLRQVMLPNLRPSPALLEALAELPANVRIGGLLRDESGHVIGSIRDDGATVEFVFRADQLGGDP